MKTTGWEVAKRGLSRAEKEKNGGRKKKKAST